MKRIALFSSIAGAALTAMVSGASAQTVVWVSSTGSGSTCTRTAPCATFQAAHDAAPIGAEINCIDSGSFGALSINKGIAIDCSNVAASASSVFVNASSTSNIRLRGLKFNGTGSSVAIDINGGSSVLVENCSVTNFGTGIQLVAPTAYGTRLSVTDSFLKNNGSTSNNSGSGISVFAGGSATTRVTIERTQFTGNIAGIIGFAASAGTGVLAMVVTDSVISNSFVHGVFLFNLPGNPRVSVTLDRSVVSASGNAGIRADGTESYVVLNGTTVIANSIGLDPVNGATILSYRNNALLGNFTDGAPTVFTALN